LSKGSERQLRADAAQNRERLIAAARDAFAAEGESVSLEQIARMAGVGIGTLYRNFRTREAIVEAVYRSELDAVAASVDGFLAEHKAFDALMLWLERYAAFVDTKRSMQDALRIAWTSGTIPIPETRARINATIAKLLQAGAADQTLRADVEPDDVTACLVGVFLATAHATDPHQRPRVLRLLMDGLRPQA
jgi:AcrR family transcriptional regulator